MGLVETFGQTELLLVSVVLLEVSVFAAKRMSRSENNQSNNDDPISSQAPVSGNFLSGITHTFRSPYLMGIAGFVLLYTLLSTFLYFQQATIADTQFLDRAERTSFFCQYRFLG